MTNKILISLGILSLLFVFAFLIHFRTYAEVTPVAAISTFYEKEIQTESFTKINVGRGNWNVRIYKLDDPKVIVYAGDNIHEHYMDIKVVDDELQLEIKEEFKYVNTSTQIADIYLPTLNKITSSYANIVKVSSLIEESLTVDLNEFSEVIVDSLNLDTLILTQKDVSGFTALNTKINELHYQLNNHSSAFIKLKPGISKGEYSGNSRLALGTDVFYADTSVISSNKIFELMPELELLRNEASLNIYMKNKFNAELSKQGNLIEDSPDEFGYLKFIYYEHLFKGGSFYGHTVDYWHFLYVRGVLHSVNIEFKDQKESIWKSLKNEMESFYGEAERGNLSITLSSKLEDKLQWYKELPDYNYTAIFNLTLQKNGLVRFDVVFESNLKFSPSYSLSTNVNTSAIEMHDIIDRIRKKYIEQRKISLSPLKGY